MKEVRWPVCRRARLPFLSTGLGPSQALGMCIFWSEGWTDGWMGDMSVSDSRTHALYHYAPLSLIQHSKLHSRLFSLLGKDQGLESQGPGFPQRADWECWDLINKDSETFWPRLLCLSLTPDSWGHQDICYFPHFPNIKTWSSEMSSGKGPCQECSIIGGPFSSLLFSIIKFSMRGAIYVYC